MNQSESKITIHSDNQLFNSYVTAVLNELGKNILSINKANGWNVTNPDDWYEVYRVTAVTGLIHTEVSEAMEAIRKGDKENFVEELADTIIRVLDLAYGLGVDLPAALLAKLEKNKNRGHRHGGKRI